MVSTQQAKNIIDANILDTFTLFIEICSTYVVQASILGRMDMQGHLGLKIRGGSILSKNPIVEL